MKYFLHDTSSFDDEKVTELYLKFGYEGLGLFYTILEKIGKQEKPIKTDVLKAQLRVGKRLEKCWKFMEEIGIISSNNGDTFNKQLLNFSETYQIKKETTRIKVAEWRKKQTDSENVTSYVPVSNPPKVKESKGKESKENKEEEFNQLSFECDPLKYSVEMVGRFLNYWTEKNKAGKMRYELEKVFEISKRLATWKKNDEKFNKSNKTPNHEFTEADFES